MTQRLPDSPTSACFRRIGITGRVASDQRHVAMPRPSRLGEEECHDANATLVSTLPCGDLEYPCLVPPAGGVVRAVDGRLWRSPSARTHSEVIVRREWIGDSAVTGICATECGAAIASPPLHLRQMVRPRRASWRASAIAGQPGSRWLTSSTSHTPLRHQRSLRVVTNSRFRVCDSNC